jgi:lysophospholipase L1-like esterase
MKKTILLLSVLFGIANVNAGIKVYNRGIGGCNSAHALSSRFNREVAPLRARIMILGFGTNDAMNSKSLVEPDAYAANIRKLIKKARENGTEVIALISVGPVIEEYVRTRHKYDFKESLAERVNLYNNKLREIAQEDNVVMVDFNQVLTAHGVNTEASSLIRNEANSGARDGIHLTVAGADELAKAVYKSIKSYVRDGDIIVCFGDSLTLGPGLKGAGTVEGESYPARLNSILQSGE